MANTIKDQSEILEKMGIAKLNPMQEEACEVIGANANVVLLSPTGTGKTLAFLLPIIELLDMNSKEVQAMILVPSRELAIQIEQVVREMGSPLNFGGESNELWCNGGEALFLKRMIKESADFKTQVGWFTSLISKKESLSKIYKQLDKLKAIYKVIPMSQGNKKSRFIAWKF